MNKDFKIKILKKRNSQKTHQNRSSDRINEVIDDLLFFGIISAEKKDAKIKPKVIFLKKVLFTVIMGQLLFNGPVWSSREVISKLEPNLCLF